MTQENGGTVPPNTARGQGGGEGGGRGGGGELIPQIIFFTSLNL